MKKNVVRGLALALVILMCLSLLPLAAHAEEHIHNFAPMTIAPSCSQSGYVQMICEACGMGGEILSWIEPTGAHHFESIVGEDYLIEESDDYCLKPSLYWKSCVNYIDDQGTVCGASAEEAYDKAIENLQNQLNERKNSGEEADWEKIIKDAIVAFDDQYKFTVGGEGHAWVEHEAQVATCTSDGWTAYRQCANCGELAGYEVIPAKGHRWGELKHVADPTCTEDGSDTHVCEVCDLEETIVLPALGHSYGEYKVTREATCTVDGERERTCSVCGYVDKEIIPAGHKYGEFTVIKEPSCYEEGLKERVCTVCGEKETEAIPAAHKFGDFTVTMEPTCYSTGEKRSTCEVCGEEIVEWIDMAHKYENGVCVFCGTAEPEKSDAAEAEEETVAAAEEETAAEEKAEEEKLEVVSEEAAEAEVEVVAQSFELDGQTIYMVRLLPNGGTGDEMDPVVGPEGYGPVTLPECGYTREGYTFTGWNAAADGSGADYDAEYTVHANETLYAQWKSDGTESEDSGEGEDSSEKEEALSVGDTEVFDNPGEEAVLHAEADAAFLTDTGISELEAVKLTGPEDKYLNLSCAIYRDSSEGTSDTLVVNLYPETLNYDDYKYYWYRDKDRITSANKPQYTVTRDDIGHAISCAVIKTVDNVDHSESSDVLYVRQSVTLNIDISNGYGSVQITQTNPQEPDAPLDTEIYVRNATNDGKNSKDSKKYYTVTDNVLTVIATPEEDTEFVLRARGRLLGSPTKYDSTTKAYTFSYNAVKDDDGEYVGFIFDQTHYAASTNPETTSGVTDKNNKTSQKALEAVSGGVKGEIYYVEPKWDSDGSFLTSENVSALGGISFTLPYPDGVGSSDEIFVYHYKDSWKQLPVGQYATTDKGVEVQSFTDFNDTFNAFVVVANKKTPATIEENVTVPEGGTILRDGVEITEPFEGVIGDEVTYTITPNEGYAVRSVKFNDEVKNLSNGSFAVTVKGGENTLEVEFAAINMVDNEPEKVKTDATEALKTYAENISFSTDLSTIRFVTPVWADNSIALSSEEIQKNGGITFTIDYPNGVVKNASSDDYVILVLHYNGSSWVELTNGVNLLETKAEVTSTEFSPFAVLAAKKNVTLKFYSKEGASLSTYVPDMNAINGKAVVMPDGSGYAKEQGKAFKGWFEESAPSKIYAAGESYTPNSGDTPIINFYAELRNGVAVTFHANNGTTETKTQLVVPYEATALEANTFNYPGHTFKNWADNDNNKTYKDRENITTPAAVDLYAQWYDKEAPAAPEDVTVTKSIINYDSTSDETKKATGGTISGTNTMMERYSEDGNWIAINGSTLTILKPGDYEFRYKEVSPYPPSKVKTVTVHQYNTEKTTGQQASSVYGVSQADLEEIYAEARIDDVYVYDVTLYETMPSGETITAPGGKTVLNEDVEFVLAYPTGKTVESNSYTLYNLDDGTEITTNPQNDGIHGTAKQFGRFVLFLNSKLNGTVNLDNTEPKAGETVTATVSNPAIGRVKYDGKLEYCWFRVDQDGNETQISEKFSTDNTSYTVTGEDLMYTLKCKVRCQPVEGDDTIPENTISAETKQVRVKLTELYTLSGNYSTDYLGYFDGVTKDMQVSYDGRDFESVTDSTWGTHTDGNKFLVKNSGVYLFRYSGVEDLNYWDGGTIEGWYVVGYTINTSYGTDNSGSGTVSMRNGSTTLSSSTTIRDSNGDEIIKPYGTNHWLVKAGATTDLHIIIRPSGSSSSSSSSSSNNSSNGTYAHVSLNGRAYTSFNSQREYNVSPVTFNQEWTVIFNRSSTSPRTGDMSNLGLWSALCFLSVVGMGTVCGSAYKRKKAHK